MRAYRFFIGLLWLILLPGVFSASIDSLKSLIHFPPWFSVFLAGLLMGLLIDCFLLSRIPGLGTFEHELTHALVALFFGRRITQFRVTARNGGYIVYSSGRGGLLADDFITLAPYYLPTLTFISIFFKPLAPSDWYFWFLLWCGFSLGFHVSSTCRETINNWSFSTIRPGGSDEDFLTDIAHCGAVFSGINILFLNLVMHSFILIVLGPGFREIPNWLQMIIQRTINLLLKVFDLIAGLF